ncbi:MAG TPA: hypothetical protein VGY57_05770 [Vicinamibacterales bacterium]|jgi:hypothetical protein|nr:hypothetical protein [Vicinamibacterales bacterium]
MSKCKCPDKQTLYGDIRGGSGVFASEGQAITAANGFADRGERLARIAGNAAKRAAECELGPQGQLCLCKTSAVQLDPWTAVGAIRTPPAPYNGWLARGGCTWTVKVECEIIELAELEREPIARKPQRRAASRHR